ncbi:unnamed protein product [Effrenium voratum]|nr:unnamed protein product [Effrenium voratum]
MNVKALIRRAKEAPEVKAKPSSNDSFESEPEALGLACLPSPAWRELGLRSAQLAQEWLPEASEAAILRNLQRRPGDFVALRSKRTARFGGDPGPPFVPEPLPDWLNELCAAVSSAAGLPMPNHVLVNHYQPGQGILPHTDGPAYMPWAAILSLGSAAVFDFWRDHAHAASGEAPALSLLLPPRSLLVFSEEAYSCHLHGLAERRFDRLQEQRSLCWRLPSPLIGHPRRWPTRPSRRYPPAGTSSSKMGVSSDRSATP